MTEPERIETANGAVLTKFRVAVTKQVPILDVEEEEPAEVGKDWYEE